jgi:nucleoside-diphosphate-sugar epimerase
VVPGTEDLVFQAVHSLDVGEAFRLAVTDDSARGAYNLAAEPVLDSQRLASVLDARSVRVPAKALRAAAKLTWQARLQPTSPGWVDMALQVPVMDTTRAKQGLGWNPHRTSEQALLDLLDGMGHGASFDTPPLSHDSSGPMRVRELLSGVGGRSR